MSPSVPQENSANRPRVGIPWRTTEEQREKIREKLDYYFEAVRKAGGEPVEVSLEKPVGELAEDLQKLDGFVLPGSPADVDPVRYGAARHLKTGTLDKSRDRTDEAILEHALRAAKPVLAICYGCQMLNVHLNGSLIQDIRTDKPETGPHGHTDLPPGARAGDIWHDARLTDGSRLAKLNQGTEAKINSSHHQAIERPGEKLKVTAQSPDGIIEGVEWIGDANWVVGVQWHPERMPGDAFAERLFKDFVAAVRSSRSAMAQKS